MIHRVAMIDPSAFTIPYDVHLCRALKDAGAKVTFYTRPTRENDYFVQSVHENWAVAGSVCQTVEHFYRVSERLPGRAGGLPWKAGLKGMEHVWNMNTLRRLLKRLQPNVVHFQWLVIPGVDRHFVRRLRAQAPVILTVHDTNAFLSPTSKLQKLGWRTALQGFDRLIVHTQVGMRSLIDLGIDEVKVSVIPHGVFDSSGHHKEADATARNPDLCTLLAFGSIKHYKGLDILIRALAQLPTTARSKTRLIVAGNPGASENILRALAEESGVASHIEWILKYIPDDQIPALFNRCDAVVFPYREIDASGALMTALPYGKAVVASRLGLFDELLQHEETALLVEPDNPSALAMALTEIADYPARTTALGERSAKLAKEVCGWERIAKLTLEVYSDASS